MQFSKNYAMSEDQAVTVTAVSTNVIDLGSPGTPIYGNQLNGDIGKGKEVPLFAQVTEDFAGLTSMQVTLEVSNNSDLTSSTVLADSGAIAAADLVAGKRLLPRVLPDGAVGQYLGVRYTVVGTATAGTVSANIGEVQTNFTGA